ncbi:hypothetical protein P170DRAFT_464215 [Aspergillus steynii IBT 23096]|uniref:Gamma-glutamylcyclotransferase AIG2-like domain-containing protein n=1 Tax=Aspergillus steynii IBT 23096 TaxID=1392250 RepID=A0A2I2GED3_9EURO|nr:uncharacterized protein P170DRAFT_464215 [Aspergillus steynii IBT 23096]PLB51258.1 hypothetical protein P170DRAFT_464215 [Aspergillus steynii IBT 23096]
MNNQTWHPKDYQDAMSNTLSDEDLTRLLKQPGCAPRFVYGALMLPTVLKCIINESQTVNIHERMTRATVSGFRLYQFSSTSTPVMRRSRDPGSVVEGILVLGLDETQRNAIYELECGLMGLVSVEVQIYVRENLEELDILNARTVDAGAFVWVGSSVELIPMKSSRWAVDGFLKEPFYESIETSQRRRALDGEDRPPEASDGGGD